MTVSATDRDFGDNGRIQYSMLQVEGFAIDQGTGECAILTSAQDIQTSLIMSYCCTYNICIIMKMTLNEENGTHLKSSGFIVFIDKTQ